MGYGKLVSLRDKSLVERISTSIKMEIQMRGLSQGVTVALKGNEDNHNKYRYHSGYNSVPSIKENLIDIEREFNVLRNMFTELSHADFDKGFVRRIIRGEVKLPDGAERWVLCPRWQIFAEQYGEALEVVFSALREVKHGNFHNSREMQLGPYYLTQIATTKHIFDRYSKEQMHHGILVIPIQLGMRFCGISSDTVKTMFCSTEGGIDSFTTSIILLTHLNRLQNNDDLWISCPGDRYVCHAGGTLVHTPIFRHFNNQIDYSVRFESYKDPHIGYGSIFALR